MTINVKVRFEGEDFETMDLTIGSDEIAAKRCGVKFNPTGDRSIANMKALAAALMQQMQFEFDGCSDPDAKRALATAMTNLESAQMFAVKGIAHRLANFAPQEEKE